MSVLYFIMQLFCIAVEYIFSKFFEAVLFYKTYKSR